MAKITITGFIAMNLLAFILFKMVLKVSYVVMFEKSFWIFILVPLAMGIIQPLINRDLLLVVENDEKRTSIQKKIEELLYSLNYKEIKKKDRNTCYNYGSRWKRIIYYPFNSIVRIESKSETIKIFGKSNLLNQIEIKLHLEFA